MAEVRFAVRVAPRANRDGIDGIVDGDLRLRVTAAPVEGAANDAVVRLIAKELKVPRSAVRLVSGDSSRHKVIAVEGAMPESIVAHWPGLRV